MKSGPDSFDRSTFRKPHNRLLGQAAEAAAPLLRAGTRIAARRAPGPPKTWKRGLILAHNHMGDVLYRTCSLPALREGLPDCKWSFLTSPASSEVLEGNPFIDEVLPWNIGENSWTLSPGSFRKLRERDFDVALCTNSLRYYPDLFLASGLGIPNRVAFTHKGLSGLVTHQVPIEFPSPYAGYFRSIVSAVTSLNPDWPLQPAVFSDDQVDVAANEAWREAGLHNGLPVLGCSITTRQRAGNFPVSVLLEIIREARKLCQFRIAFFGATGDASFLNGIATEFGDEAAVLAGRLSIREFSVCLSKCRALLTLDSGPRHLGNAARIPVFFARNMSHSKIEAGAYCSTETDIAPDGEYMSDDQIAAASRSVSPSGVAARLVVAMGDGERQE